MSVSSHQSDALCHRLASLLRQADTHAAIAFAHAYPHHKAITAPISTDLQPVHYACLLADSTLICALLHSGAQVDTKALKLAARVGHIEPMNQLLSHVSASVIQSAGEAVFEAAFSGAIQCVCALVEAGAPTGFRASDGSMPLHLAAMSGSVAMVDCLLQSGANPTVVDAQGATPAMCAKRVGHRAVAGRLWAATTELEEQRVMGAVGTTGEIRAKSKAMATSFKEKLKEKEDGCISTGDRTAGVSPTLSDDLMEVHFEEDLPECWEDALKRKLLCPQ